jgi:hypothetical protein
MYKALGNGEKSDMNEEKIKLLEAVSFQWEPLANKELTPLMTLPTHDTMEGRERMDRLVWALEDPNPIFWGPLPQELDLINGEDTKHE